MSDRLGSWKEIAAYLGRGVRSVQRWEREEGLPVHRLAHQTRGSVYAYKSELDQWWHSRRQYVTNNEPKASEAPLGNEVNTAHPARISAKSVGLIAGIVLLAGTIAYPIRFWLKGVQGMRQVTSMGSVRSFGCSLSSDGKRIAFASDAQEEGNLDIWVQDTEHPPARRLTQAVEPDVDPSISPDGTKVLFVSRRVAGFGIYQVSVNGGDERFLIPEGEEPRYSPTGRAIAYLKGSEPRHLYVADADGDKGVEIPTGLTRPRHLTWSPDGNYLLVSGQRNPGEQADWWVVPVNGGPVVETQLLHDLVPYISSSLRQFFYPQAWLPGKSVLFAADQDGVWSIWRIRLSSSFRLTGRPERITGRTPIDVRFTVGRNVLAFVNARPDNQLWRLPIDVESGQLTGSPRRITRAGIFQFPSLSMDGSILVFCALQMEAQGGRNGIYVRNVKTGDEVIIGSPSEATGYTTLSRDGSKIAYSTIVPGLKRPIYIYDRSSGSTRRLCEDCEGRPYDWSPDATKLVLSMPGNRIGLLDLKTGDRSVISPGTAAVFSPNGRWLAVVGADPSGRISIVTNWGRGKPATAERRPVGDSDSTGVLVGWSPGGERLYFVTASRDDPPRYTLKAQRVHTDTGQLEGTAVLIYRFEEPVVPLATLPLNNRLAIGPGQIILASGASAGDIWAIQTDNY
jgi:Tol biopolymer transport system component